MNYRPHDSYEPHTPEKPAGWLCAIPGFFTGVAVSIATGEDAVDKYVSHFSRYGDDHNEEIIELVARIMKRL